MDYSAMSLAELRAEAKKVRNELYKPVSRSKKSDLVAELTRHKGVSSSSTKSESSVSTAPPEPEKARPKKVKAEKKEEKKEAPKKEKKAPKKEKEPEVLSLKRKAKNEAEPPMPKKKAKKDE